jgi:hypothetical protein
VEQDVLAKRGAPLQSTKDAQQFRWNASYANLERGSFAILQGVGINLTLGLRHDLFDANRVDPTVLHKTLKGDTRHLASDWIKR